MAEHPEQKTHFQSTDQASQSNQAEYENMIDTINHAMDPNSNTVLVVDDETPIRKFVSRQIRKSSTGIVIFEAENGQDALVSIAKETCMDAGKFDAKGEKGLTRWLKHLMKNT